MVHGDNTKLPQDRAMWPLRPGHLYLVAPYHVLVFTNVCTLSHQPFVTEGARYTTLQERRSVGDQRVAQIRGV